MKVNMNRGILVKVETIPPGAFFIYSGDLYIVLGRTNSDNINVMCFNDDVVGVIKNGEIVQYVENKKIEVTVK